MIDFRDLIDRFKDGEIPVARYGVIAGVIVLTVAVVLGVYFSLPGSKKATTATPVDVPAAFALRSIAFKDGDAMPAIYTADGENRSPPLDFLLEPDNAVELALICDDPDAGRGGSGTPWVHWVIYKIPPASGGLAEQIEPVELPPYPVGAMQGMNSWDEVGYRGPAPPPGSGTHHYVFTLYALSEPLEDAEPGLTRDELLDAMRGTIINEARFVGTFKR